MKKRIFSLLAMIGILALNGCSIHEMVSSTILRANDHSVYLKASRDDKITFEPKISSDNSKAVVITLKSDDPAVAIDKVYANGVELSGNNEGQYQFEMPDSDVEITYTTKVASYRVRFLDYDYSVLEEETLNFGSLPSFDKEAPSRNPTREGNYTFKGWDKDIAAVTGNIDYQAVYDIESAKGFVFTLNDDKNSYSLTYYGGEESNVVVPNSYLGLDVTEIGPYAFYNAKNMETVTIPENVIKVDDNAFSLSGSLKNILGMKNVSFIGSEAFSETPNLEKVEINSETIKSIGDGAFLNSGIISIALPDNIAPAKELFNGAKRLTEVHLPDSWDLIPAQTFYNCYSLVKWNWPSNVSVIDSYSFFGASSLTEIKDPSLG